MQRAVTLINGGDQNLAGITLTTTASPSSIPGLGRHQRPAVADRQLPRGVDRSRNRASYTYTCSGTPAHGTSVLAKRAVIGRTCALPDLTSMTAAKTDYLRVTMSVPDYRG